MTSLSLAGGVYCFGFEGAVIGPVVLCLLIVIGRMLSTAYPVSTNEIKSQLKRSESLRTSFSAY